MTKVIKTNTLDGGTERLVTVPGATGYAARYVAAHLDMESGATVSSWTPTSAGGTLSLLGAPPSVLSMGDDGEYFVTSPGGQNAGGRLIGPHTAQRPFTIAAVIKADAGTLNFCGMTGISLSRRADGYWYQGGGTNAVVVSTENTGGWVTLLMTTHADNTHSFAINGVTTAKVATTTPSTSFGGFYFGASAAGQYAHVREVVIFHRDLSPGDRDGVTQYFRASYPDLS